MQLGPSAPKPGSKMRFKFDITISSISLERDAIDHPLVVTVARGGKVAKTTAAATCTLLDSLDGYSGFGRHVYKDGSKYTGRYSDGVRHGRGVLRFPSGGYYEGGWEDDRYKGHGRYVCADGVYEGDFVDGTFCGRGVYRWGSGDVYEGEYKENMPHGIGKKVYSGGGLEEGLWERGEFLGCPDLGDDYTEFTGYGRKVWADGSSYVGEWAGGKRQGRGIFTFASGDSYEGGWQDDKFEGHGKYISPDGTYEGEHRDNLWSGTGEYRWNDGRVYQGEFRESAFHGSGKMLYPDGSTRKGRWEYDEFIGSDSDDDDDDDDDDVSPREDHGHEGSENAANPHDDAANLATMPVPEPHNNQLAGPSFAEVVFKDSGPTGLILVERNNVTMGKLCLYLDEILPRSSADSIADLRCGMVLYSVQGHNVTSLPLTAVLEGMKRRPLALKFVDVGHFTGSVGSGVALARQRHQTVVVDQTISLISTLKPSKKGKPELGYKSKPAKLVVLQTYGKRGQKSKKVGSTKLNLANFIGGNNQADESAQMQALGAQSVFECETKLKSLSVMASIVSTWVPPGSALDDFSDAESEVSDMSWYTSGSSAVSDTANLNDFDDLLDEDGNVTGDFNEDLANDVSGTTDLLERESVVGQDKPLHTYNAHDVAISLRKLNLAKYEPYFRERRIDGIALSTLSNTGWDDLFENVLQVPVSVPDREAIRARFGGQAPKSSRAASDPNGARGRSEDREDLGQPARSPSSAANMSKLRRGVKGMIIARGLMAQPEPEPEPELDDLATELLRFSYDNCTLHVGGLGGEFESEEILRTLFEPYGRFIQATVRMRPGINKSWALVSLGNTATVDKVLRSTIMAGEHALVVKKVAVEKAMASTGMFPQLWRVAKTRSEEVIKALLASETPSAQPSQRQRRRSSTASVRRRAAGRRNSARRDSRSSVRSSDSSSPPPDSASWRLSTMSSGSVSGARSTRTKTLSAQLMSVAEAFDLYCDEQDGSANLQQLRAIMKALNQRLSDDELLEVIGGDPEASVNLAAVQQALRGRGYTESEEAPASPAWRRTRLDSETAGNKFSSLDDGAQGKGSAIGLLRRRTRTMMLAQRMTQPSGQTVSRLDTEQVDQETVKESLAIAQQELVEFRKCLEDITAEDPESLPADKSAQISRLLNGKLSSELATAGPTPLMLAAASKEERATRQLLERAVQDLCEMKVLMSESDAEIENLQQQKRETEKRMYELETDKSSLYSNVVESKLNLAESELGRQKLTVSLKRERHHRDRLGQRIASLELRLASETASPGMADGANASPTAVGAESQRVRRRAENGLQVFGGLGGGAGGASDEDEDEEEWSPPVNAKSAKSREIIRESIRNEELFSHLQPEQMKMIIAAMARSEHQPKETIIEKGAMTSQYFVLEDGKCEIETSDGDVFLLATGSAFGESSLLQPSNSTRSITARSRCLLWRLDRSVYLGIVVRTTAQRKRKFEKLLSKVQLLQAISPTERSMIADCLQAHFARAKSVIIAQGEKGDYFYIIMKGTVVVLDRHGMELSKLGEGQYFGEAALLSDAPRGATIQAVTDCELARIDKKTFVRLLGTLKDLNFREYEQKDDGTLGAVKPKSPEAKKAAVKTSDVGRQVSFTSTEVRKQDHKLTAFETIGQLGKGAFGSVRLVRYRLTNTFYALKVISKRVVLQKKQVSKVVRERENLAICNAAIAASGSMLKVHAVFQDERNLYLLTEYLSGGELFAMLPLKLREARLVAGQVALALGALHDLGIVHRDVKPENLLLDRNGHVKLVDFGLSKRVVERTFTFCGTPDYMAPEIVQNLGHNKAVDYWALGCLLFEMLVGQAPFHRPGGEVKLFERIIRAKVEFPSAVPKVAAHLILRLLEKDLSKRFGNLREGPSDVKKHRFFQGVDWGQLAARKFVAGGNLKPNLSGEGDMSRFAGSVDTAAQPALDESLATMIPRAQQALFKDWQ